MTSAKKQVSFLPFNALNEFMRDDFRHQVVLTVLQALPSLPEQNQAAVNRLLKKMMSIPGFRNSLAAPLSLKLKPAISAFEKSSALSAAILAAWAATKPELQQNVYDLLTERGWEVLPLEADRTKLPGFLSTWPAADDFEKINQFFREHFPESIVTTDDVSLMAVWISGRLPMETVEPDTGEDEKSEP